MTCATHGVAGDRLAGWQLKGNMNEKLLLVVVLLLPLLLLQPLTLPLHQAGGEITFDL